MENILLKKDLLVNRRKFWGKQILSNLIYKCLARQVKIGKFWLCQIVRYCNTSNKYIHLPCVTWSPLGQCVFLSVFYLWLKMLKRREECDIYLINVCRHHWRGESPVKRGNIKSFQPTLWLQSAVDLHSTSTVLAESFSLGSPPFGDVYRHESDRCHTLLFNTFYHFTFPGFPFILISLFPIYSIVSNHPVYFFEVLKKRQNQSLLWVNRLQLYCKSSNAIKSPPHLSQTKSQLFWKVKWRLICIMYFYFTYICRINNFNRILFGSWMNQLSSYWRIPFDT